MLTLFLVLSCALPDSPDKNTATPVPQDSPGDSVVGLSRPINPKWSDDNVTMFALATLSGDTHQSVVAINTTTLTVRKIVEADSVQRFAFAPDSAAIYGLIDEPLTSGDPTTYGAVRLVRIDIGTGAKSTVTRMQEDLALFSRDGSRLAYVSQARATTPDSMIVLDVVTGAPIGAAIFPTPFAAYQSVVSIIPLAVSADGLRVLVHRPHQLGPYPSMLFDWNVATSHIDSTPAFNDDREVTGAWTSTGFRIANFDYNGAIAPNVAFQDVGFGGSDSTAYLRVMGSRLPDRISWLPERRTSWASVLESCYDTDCQIMRAGIYLSTPTSVAQVGSINSLGSVSLWAAPNGRLAVAYSAGRGVFVLRR